MSETRIPTDQELHWLTRRAVAEIIPEEEFIDGLRSGRRLRLKMGFDPTRPVITLGWAVGLRKLRQLQELGHTVVVIIGDWTARIGDPSGASQTRPMLTAEEVNANSQAILRQFYKILDERRTEIRRQSEWFDAFTLTDVVRLAGRFTVAQILQRDDFAQRYAAHKPIGVHEVIYPLLQAYDSVAVEADVEFGGTDQKFNNLVGRELQRMLGQKCGPAAQGQAVFLVPLLVGLDGAQKMSQSLGNYIAIDAPPHDMYGKIMSLPDDLMLHYFELLTDVPDGELAEIRETLAKSTVNPMDVKMRLAREIVGQFHSPEAAQNAEEEFVRVFRRKEEPEEVVEFRMSVKRDFMPQPLRNLKWSRIGEPKAEGEIVGYSNSIPHILHAAGFVKSISEGIRLVKQGAVERSIEGGFKKVEHPSDYVYDGMIIRVGKHRFLRIVDSDKQ